MTEPRIATFDGSALSDGVFIARETNPWVEANGAAIDWMTVDVPRVCFLDCDQCGHVIAGVIEAMDCPNGVQRCDQCEKFPGDLEAAHALAQLVGGVVRFEQEA